MQTIDGGTWVRLSKQTYRAEVAWKCTQTGAVVIGDHPPVGPLSKTLGMVAAPTHNKLMGYEDDYRLEWGAHPVSVSAAVSLTDTKRSLALGHTMRLMHMQAKEQEYMYQSMGLGRKRPVDDRLTKARAEVESTCWRWDEATLTMYVPDLQ